MEHQLSLPGDWPVGVRRCALPALDSDDLESVLSWLQEAAIDAWIGTTPPIHIAAGVHDPYGGDDIRQDFHSINGEWPRGEIARWLVDTVLGLGWEDANAAAKEAAAQGWVMVQGDHSVCLKEEGRQALAAAARATPSVGRREPKT